MIIKATVKCLMSPPHTSNSWTNEKWYICLSSKCVEIDIVINIQVFCDAYYAIYKYFYKYNVHVIYKNLVHITLKVPLSARLKVKVSYLEYKVKWKYTICHLFIYVWCFWAITKMYVIGLYDHSLFFGRKILLPNTCTIHTAWKSSLVVQNREMVSCTVQTRHNLTPKQTQSWPWVCLGLVLFKFVSAIGSIQVSSWD